MTNPLHKAFADRMQIQLGEEFPAFLRALDMPALRGIRFNPFKIIQGEPLNGIEQPVPWARNAWYLCNQSQAGATVLHEAGAFYLQEPCAMFPAEVLDAQPGEKILDLCAAPGGKSTQIGCAMQGQGLLVCNEPVYKRAVILSRNIERIGLPHTVVTCAQPEQLAGRWPGLFDAVLVDVPCSGEGMFRRDPLTRGEWSPEQAAGCVARQRKILSSAAVMVRPGGRLIYSTCTYNPEENEKNAEWFLKNNPDYEPEAFSLPEIDAPEGHYTCYPHRLKGEGQFAAKFRRKGTGGTSGSGTCRFPVPDSMQLSLLRNQFPSFPKATFLFGQTLVHSPGCPDLAGIKTLRVGLHLGEFRGTAFIPDHAAALCIHTPEIQTKDLLPEEAIRYTAGETLLSSEEGWILIRYRGIAAGWGKCSGGIVRNHYPKGLRKNHLLP